MEIAASTLRWQAGSLHLVFGWGADRPVVLESVTLSQDERPLPAGQHLVEIVAAGHGRARSSMNYTVTGVGERLRHLSHDLSARPDGQELRLTQVDEVTGLRVVSVFAASAGVAGFRTWTEVRNDGGTEVALQAVSTFVCGAVLGGAMRSADGLELVVGRSQWLAEGVWRSVPLRDAGLVDIGVDVHHKDPRGRVRATASSSWSTGEDLPTAALLLPDGRSLAWQIEHNGPWHWELAERRDGVVLGLFGPTDTEHQWWTVLRPGDGFTSVPASIAIGRGGVDGAFRALTAQRRSLLTPHPERERLAVVFNDYMNTLMGDPTTEKLLPLVEAAAAVGAEYFCIDAGWYDDGGDWWDSVGEWRPSTLRFPRGLDEVTTRIHQLGMVPGLWLEPEVVGVRSPMADRLPDEAFFRRHGIRLVEQGRHHLDLSHPAAREHLDSTVDRLVSDFGIGYLKLDYNIMPGIGTDGASSAGEGMLRHNRAYLDWLDGVIRRHPAIVLENCSSGGMRMDYALLSRMHLQSTSDQQDMVRYAAIAAAAPASVLPEQAGNWAYPHTAMSPEAFCFALCCGMPGRLYLSGYLNEMTDSQRAMVAEAVMVHKGVRGRLAASLPRWPLGLPAWDAAWVAVGLDLGPEETFLVLWWRSGQDGKIVVPLPHLTGADVQVTQEFPTAAERWATGWDPVRGELEVDAGTGPVSARCLTIVRRA